MILPTFIQCFAKPILLMDDLTFISICPILSSILKKIPCYDGIFVLCRQSRFLLTAQSQQLNNIMKTWKSYWTFILWYCILIFFKQTSYTLSTMFIHRYIFEFVTCYGDITKTASLQLKIFLYMLHQQDNFDCINAKHIIVIWKIPPSERILYVFHKEAYFFLHIFLSHHT